MPTDAEVADLLRRLKKTPQHFKKAAEGLTDPQLRSSPAPGEWSVHEVLAHLWGAVNVQSGWIERVLSNDLPIRYASARTGMKKIDHANTDFATLLKGYGASRAALVKRLGALDLADWSRTATFTGTSPGWAQTIYDIASGTAGHEHSHFPQITEAARAGATT